MFQGSFRRMLFMSKQPQNSKQPRIEFNGCLSDHHHNYQHDCAEDPVMFVFRTIFTLLLWTMHYEPDIFNRPLFVQNNFSLYFVCLGIKMKQTNQPNLVIVLLGSRNTRVRKYAVFLDVYHHWALCFFSNKSHCGMHAFHCVCTPLHLLMLFYACLPLLCVHLLYK